MCAALVATYTFAASPVIVDATGRILAFYEGPVDPNSLYLRGITTQGFVVIYRMDVAEMEQGSDASGGSTFSGDAIYFSGPMCTGSTFGRLDAGPPPYGYNGGFLFKSSNDVWYVPKNAPVTTENPQSVRSGGNCSPTIQMGTYVPVFPNDPIVTGLSNTPPQAPLRIEVATINDPSGLLLRDGFETVG